MRNSTSVLLLLILLGVTALTLGCGSNRHEFRKNIEVDFDMEDIPEPKTDPAPQYYDFFDRTFSKQIHQGFDMPRNFRKIAGKPKQAENVDAFGNVPNSSWFTNRNGKRSRSIEEIKRGPDTGDGPADGMWTVIRAKTEGVTPGFTVRDGRGGTFVIKFDPQSNPEMGTGAEIISTKLFYAMGYNTPENRIVFFTADRLRIDPEATVTDPLGHKRPMTRDDLDDIRSRVHKRSDGIYRAVASKFLAGKPKGPYLYVGTRKDDANDIIPHEHRRELRGLRLFGAWLNHNDIRRINSLDMYVEEEGRRFLRHYLIDFGATLGSASVHANVPSEGLEYQFDHWEAQKSLYTLGLYNRRWREAKEPQYQSVGYFESELFNPARWKPNYPNPAFENMTNLDALWATKIIMSFTDEQIQAAVEMGELSDPEAAAYLARILIERRDKIGRHWYGKVNAIDNFELSGSGASQTLQFADLEVRAGFESLAGTQYRYRLTHNACKGTKDISDQWILDGNGVSGVPAISLEDALAAAAQAWEGAGSREECDRFFYLTFWTRRVATSDWGKWAKVHFYFNDPQAGFEIIAVQHEE
ncbi:MAG: hypothetical protein V3V49_13635 [Candidatus Krumholzibacteria bacterium]